MSNGDIFLITIVIGAFITGYLVVSFVVKRIQGGETTTCAAGEPSPRKDPRCEGPPNNGRLETEDERTRHTHYRQQEQEQTHRTSRTWTLQSEDQKFAAILGLRGRVAPEDVKRAYRELLAKYHPDKVGHLGEEFRVIAETKTREIISAYEFLRKKYDVQ